MIRSRIGFAAVCLMVVGSCLSARAADPAPAPPAVEWSHDIIASFLKARDEQRPFVVLFDARWSEWCRRLEKETLASGEFRDFAGRAVFADIDVDDPGNGAKDFARMMQSLDIKTYPTLVVMWARPDEIREVGRIVGHLEPKEYSRRFAMLLVQHLEEDKRRLAQRVGATVDARGAGDAARPAAAPAAPGDAPSDGPRPAPASDAAVSSTAPARN
jgi:thiol-disulfide isomerase/thioredoxin